MVEEGNRNPDGGDTVVVVAVVVVVVVVVVVFVVIVDVVIIVVVVVVLFVMTIVAIFIIVLFCRYCWRTMTIRRRTLKGALVDFFFFTISSQRRQLSPTRKLKWPGHNRVQITCNTSGAYYVQHDVRDVEGRVSSAIKFDKVEIVICFSFFSLVKTINRRTQRKPPTTRLKMSHSKAQKFKSQPTLEPAL